MSGNFRRDHASTHMKPNEKEFLAGYDAYADAIFRHLSFRVRDRETAKDMLQQTFTKVWEYMTKGGEIENMRAFLYKTAGNLIIDSYRKKGAQSLDALLEEGFEMGDEEAAPVSTVAEVGELREALLKIPDPYRQVVTMRYIDELSPQEIAQATGETANAVSVRIHRGVEMLKKELRI